MTPSSSEAPGSGSDVPALAKGAGINLIGRMGGRGVHVLTQVWIARYLGPAAFGAYALGLTLLRIASVISPTGLDRGVVHFAAPDWKTAKSRAAATVFKAEVIATGVGLGIGVLLAVNAEFVAQTLLGDPNGRSIVLWIAIGVPFAGLLRVGAGASRATKQMQYGVCVEDIAQPCAALLFFGLVAALGLGPVGATAATVVSFGVGAAVAVGLNRYLFGPAVFADRKIAPSVASMLRFSIPASVGSVSTMLVQWIDRLAVGYFLTTQDLGMYQAASQTALLFAIIMSSFTNIFVPMIATLRDAKNRPRLEQVFRMSIKWPLYLSMPALLAVVIVPDMVLSAVYGSAYANASQALFVLGAGQLVNLATGSVGLLLIMTGRQVMWFRMSGTALATAIVANVVLVPAYGLVGAALATSLSTGLLFLAGLGVVRRELHLWPYNRSYLAGLAGTLMASIPFLLLRAGNFSQGSVELICATLAAGLLMTATLWLIGLPDEDREFLTTIGRKLTRA